MMWNSIFYSTILHGLSAIGDMKFLETRIRACTPLDLAEKLLPRWNTFAKDTEGLVSEQEGTEVWSFLNRLVSGGRQTLEDELKTTEFIQKEVGEATLGGATAEQFEAFFGSVRNNTKFMAVFDLDCHSWDDDDRKCNVLNELVLYWGEFRIENNISGMRGQFPRRMLEAFVDQPFVPSRNETSNRAAKWKVVKPKVVPYAAEQNVTAQTMDDFFLDFVPAEFWEKCV